MEKTVNRSSSIPTAEVARSIITCSLCGSSTVFTSDEHTDVKACLQCGEPCLVKDFDIHLTHPSNQPGPTDVSLLFTPRLYRHDQRKAKISREVKNLAYLIMECCPICDDRMTAVKKLREVVIFASASIDLEQEVKLNE